MTPIPGAWALTRNARLGSDFPYIVGLFASASGACYYADGIDHTHLTWTEDDMGVWRAVGGDGGTTAYRVEHFQVF